MLGAPRKSRAFTNDYFIFATQALVDPECRIDFAVSGHWTVPARHAPGASRKAGSNVLVRYYLSAVSDCCKPGMSFGVGNVHAFTRTIFKSTAETDTPRTSCSFSPLLGMDSIRRLPAVDSSHGRVGRRPPSIRLPGRLLSVAGIFQTYIL